jgi:hypothetical protein
MEKNREIFGNLSGFFLCAGCVTENQKIIMYSLRFLK